MPHFTYVNPDQNTLSQGDIIRVSEPILTEIKKIHPYFGNGNYPYFLVLTQSCDLQRRSGQSCKSRYITISAIRSFDECIDREVQQFLSSDIEKSTRKIIDETKKEKIKQILAKLYNNNHPDYFYLHDQVSSGITNPLVAFLRVSIALKAELHYDLLLQNKVLELKDEFKAKLGWLVGNLYSRVGTDDWVPKTTSEEGFNKMISDKLNETFIWQRELKSFEKKLIEILGDKNLSDLTDEELLRKIGQIKLPTKKEKVFEILETILTPFLEDNMKTVLTKLKNDSSLARLLK